MTVATYRVGLPDLYECIWDRCAIAIIHATFDPDALTRSLDRH
jgi:hypothetical protein